MGIFPQVGMKIQNIWNHHLATLEMLDILCLNLLKHDLFFEGRKIARESWNVISCTLPTTSLQLGLVKLENLWSFLPKVDQIYAQ